MATTTLELMLFYYPNATGRNDVKYAGELMAGAERIFAPYDIRLSIWPPDRGPYQATTVPRVSSDSWCNDHPYMDGEADTLEIVNWILKSQYGPLLLKRLLVVFGGFGNAGLSGVTFPDANGKPKTTLDAFVFVNTKAASAFGSGQRSTLAHEIGHAAGLGHVTDNKNLMYENGQARAANPSLYPIDTILIKSAFFAR